MNEGYSKVFVALDGTEQQDFVLARAIKVAANNKAKLIIGHVIDSTALESAGSYPIDLVNGLEEAFKNSIEKQVEEAKANPDIPEVEVIIRAGRIRETLKFISLDSKTLASCLFSAALVASLRSSTPFSAPSPHSCLGTPSVTSWL